MTNFLMTVQTCPGRERVLGETLASLAESDWPVPPLVVPDTLNLPNRQKSQVGTAGKVLALALEQPEWDYLVYCEDDVIFNRHLHHNLSSWLPVTLGICLVGCLYQGDKWPDQGRNYGFAPAAKIGGSQAVVIRRDWVGELSRRWDELRWCGMQDLRFFGSLGGTFPSVYVHNPNLVQHRSEPSTWGGQPHTSPNFDQDYRA